MKRFAFLAVITLAACANSNSHSACEDYADERLQSEYEIWTPSSAQAEIINKSISPNHSYICAVRYGHRIDVLAKYQNQSLWKFEFEINDEELLFLDDATLLK